jgi:hypothetical protein
MFVFLKDTAIRRLFGFLLPGKDMNPAVCDATDAQ